TEGRAVPFEDAVDLALPESLGTATGAVRESDQPE
ncbi:MAG: hypothetical protein HW413_2390, partial [Thermoleophilia bacterium]|nr:hypothetical protein [Thermoleophilia bacterium]